MLIHIFVLLLSLSGLIRCEIIFPDQTRGGNSSRKPQNCSVDSVCSVASKCRTLDLSGSDSAQLLCNTSIGTPGICCPNQSTSDNVTVPISAQFEIAQRRFFTGFRLPRFPRIQLENASKKGLQWLENLRDIEKEIIRRKIFTKRGSASQLHQDILGHSDEALRVSRNAMLIHRAGIELAQELNLKGTEQMLALRQVSFRESPVRDQCPPETPCPSTKYRLPDGSCNNLNKPRWGKTLTPFGRLLPSDYADGIDAPRSSQSGRPLPSARLVSLNLLPQSRQPSFRYSLLLMVFGQFLDHDMIQTVATRISSANGIQCCSPLVEQNPQLLHPACFPILLPRDDPFYSRFGSSCMEVVRSAPAQRPECQSGPREQMNQLSAFIDGGTIYGTSERSERLLRSFTGGLLLTSRFQFGELLPQDANTTCRSRRQQCFSAGDGRNSEHPQLTAMHTIWVREHNRIARSLQSLNPGWSDEILFQETRRIVFAEIQHITYEEFLPMILGKRIMKLFDLFPQIEGFSRSYDPSTDPSIVSSFASAAYRLHTMVPGLIELRSPSNQIVGKERLSDLFLDPEILYRPDGLSSLIYGMSGQGSDKVDHRFTPEISNNLFKSQGSGFGMDLISINIQRGRDHGVPGYNAWRQACGMRKAARFQEFSDSMDPRHIRGLAELYQSVDDVDLFVGGNLESKLQGALVGPVFACIIGEQFRRLKEGDRFWYENGNLESSFSEGQLDEIRKTSLARVLCDNGDITNIQPIAFLLESPWNHKMDCQSPFIPRMNLAPWRNEPVWS